MHLSHAGEYLLFQILVRASMVQWYRVSVRNVLGELIQMHIMCLTGLITEYKIINGRLLGRRIVPYYNFFIFFLLCC